jgi:hypothetical protein
MPLVMPETPLTPGGTIILASLMKPGLSALIL